MKTLATILKTQKNKLNITDPWCYLFILQVNATDAMYMTNNPEAIGYNSHTYSPFPIKMGEITEDSKGNLQTLNIGVSNINRMVMAYMETADGLVDKTVQIYLVNKKDTSQAINLGIYDILNSSANAEFANFVLGHYDFFDIKFPRNKYIRGLCRWLYRGTECGYATSPGLPTCDKTLEGADGCRVHTNQARFGGFPGIPYGKMSTR